jgi:hypothetical protein
VNARNKLAHILTFGLGLADEALGFDHRNRDVMVLNVRSRKLCTRQKILDSEIIRKWDRCFWRPNGPGRRYITSIRLEIGRWPPRRSIDLAQPALTVGGQPGSSTLGGRNK